MATTLASRDSHMTHAVNALETALTAQYMSRYILATLENSVLCQTTPMPYFRRSAAHSTFLPKCVKPQLF